MEDSDGRKLFSSETLDAARKLHHHIAAGCLSDIPQGGGTNRNECLHRNLNALFTRTKMGTLLAYALLTMILHAHNSSEKRQPCSLGTNCDTPITPIGIMPKPKDEQSIDHCEIDIAENTLDMDKIVGIFVQSLKKWRIMEVLQYMGLTRLKSRTLHFEELTYLQVSQTDIDTEIYPDTLHNFGLKLHPVPPNGNCFFTSIAHNMLSDMNRWTKSLSLAGVKDEEIDVNQLSTILRQTYVKELLGERRAKYEVFVSHTNMNYEEEATKFQTDGFFNSELGNTMPLALATALQFPIIIFPRDVHIACYS